MIFNEINHYNKVMKRLNTIIDALSTENCYLNFTAPEFFEDIKILLERQSSTIDSLQELVDHKS